MTDKKNEIWRFLEQRAARFPVVIKGLRCGARNRKGSACRSKELYANGRCRYHGGLSTGPRTPEGKKRVALNLPRAQAVQLLGDDTPSKHRHGSR